MGLGRESWKRDGGTLVVERKRRESIKRVREKRRGGRERERERER